MPFAKLAKMMREPEGLADVGSVRERVEMLAPWINEQLANFHEGKATTGVRGISGRDPQGHQGRRPFRRHVL